LLDTHALIWWFMDSPRMGGGMRAKLEEGDEPIFVSAASAFEISLKHRIEKLPEMAALIDGFSDHLATQGFEELPISCNHALQAGSLSIDHKDPFDRMLIAQAQLESLSLVSNERIFDRFGVIRIWD